MKKSDSNPNNYLFNPHRRLSELPIYKGVIWLYALLIAGLSIVILLNSTPLTLDLSFSGFNTLIFEILKVPVYLLGSMLPVVALIATIHRSEQIRAQMQLTQEQNIFSNYYKRVEEFEKYIESRTRSESVKFDIVNARETHEKIWPHFINGDDKINTELLSIIDNGLNKINKLYMSDCSEMSKSEIIIEICKESKKVMTSMGMKAKELLTAGELEDYKNCASHKEVKDAINIALELFNSEILDDKTPSLNGLIRSIDNLSSQVELVLKFDPRALRTHPLRSCIVLRMNIKRPSRGIKTISSWIGESQYRPISEALEFG